MDGVLRAALGPPFALGDWALDPARDKALKLLARREHSRRELERKLLQRKFSPEHIETTLDWLVERDLLSDARYARLAAESDHRRGMGPLRARARLLRAGVNETMAESAVAGAFADADQAATARAQCERRFGPLGELSRRDQQRAYRFLLQRGFRPELVRDILFGR